MQCEKIQRQLSDYLDGILPEEASRQIEKHIRECRVCADERNALELTIDLIRASGRMESISSERLEDLQSQLLDKLEQEVARHWWQRTFGSIMLQVRAWQATWFDVMDAGGWQRRLQTLVTVILLIFAGIWVDRYYYRPNLPGMIRKALVTDTAYAPASVSDSGQSLSRRGLQLMGQAADRLKGDEISDHRAYGFVAPLPIEHSEGMEVRAVELKDGKLLFVGTLDIVGSANAESEEVPLREVTMPTTNPTVVMLPRNFDEPVAPSRIRQGYVFADLLDRLVYPVASPTNLVIEDRTNQ